MLLHHGRCIVILFACLLLSACSTQSNCASSSSSCEETQSSNPSGNSDPGDSNANPSDNETGKPYLTDALRMADFLLSIQTEEGAIPDAPDSSHANLDSTMEYALIGLAAAYWQTEDGRYLDGLEKGIQWLAHRQDMSQTMWRGSWSYAYSATIPYLPLLTSPGTGVDNVRGVDATCTLFVYLLYLHKVLTGRDDLFMEYKENARAALDFVMTNNSDEDSPFFFSSWHLIDNQWELWKFQYSADQGDVYLGIEAGAHLFEDTTGGAYTIAAENLKQQFISEFFVADLSRFALGRHANGTLEKEFKGFAGIFPQGYLPWVFGKSEETQASLNWLHGHKQSDGGIQPDPVDPIYSLNQSIYVMANSALGNPVPTDAIDWLLSTTYDANAGTVRDSNLENTPVYSNVLGFTIIALLEFPNMLQER